MPTEFEPTQLRQLYDALGALKEDEQTLLAEMHAADPKRLLNRFAHSVRSVASYPPLSQGFHDDRTPPSDLPVPLKEIVKTHHFASHLTSNRLSEVAGAKDLAFRFVDQEIFPLRQTEPGGPRPARRRLDLLLISRDHLPIVGELKIRDDELTYYALVQALMYAAELSSPSQLNRLQESYEEAGFKLPVDGPCLDLYLIAFEPPVKGKFRQRSLDAAEQISETMIADERVNSVVRRIAYLDAAIGNDELVFERLFAFGPEGPS